MRMWYDVPRSRACDSGYGWHDRRVPASAGGALSGTDGDLNGREEENTAWISSWAILWWSGDGASVRPELRGMKGTVVEIIENGQVRVRSDGTGNDEWFDAAALRHE
ncbi:hypothetical protein RAA17_00895 [Komagataeibacter rhaeticus]|nr:hypothetical protein [Komagataeibacter rhaeticus]